jgi:hypothetical protein
VDSVVVRVLPRVALLDGSEESSHLPEINANRRQYVVRLEDPQAQSCQWPSVGWAIKLQSA